MKAIYVGARADRDSGAVGRRPVRAVMSRPVTTVPQRATLDDALRLMVGSGVRHLVVVDAAGAYRGVVSDRDIGAAWADDPAGLRTRLVSSIVDHAAPSVGADTRVVTAARLMRAARTDALAVTDAAGGLVGIVTGTDLIGLLARYPEPA